MYRFLVLTMLSASIAGSALSAELEVIVRGLRSDMGNVRVALYDRPDAFPKSSGMLREDKTEITHGTALISFRDLPPGSYALAVFHDENANGEFDQGFIGIPLEGYAFSAGARALFGPPSFSAAQVSLPAVGTRIDVLMSY